MYFEINNHSRKNAFKGRMVTESHYFLEYRVVENNILHFGVAALILSREGDVLNGFFITSPSLVGDMHIGSLSVRRV